MNREEEILKLFELWSAAIKVGSLEDVVGLYAANAILLPTVSDTVRHNHDELRDYFKQFLLKRPRCKIDETNIRVCGEIAINSGVYTFRFASGPIKTVQARFTFVSQWLGNKWLIIDHHSSVMPEKFMSLSGSSGPAAQRPRSSGRRPGKVLRRNPMK